VRVVATQIGPDGTMLRRVVDTGECGNAKKWEQLAARALMAASPYRPVPGRLIYHIRIDDYVFLVAEHDLTGPLGDLATAVLARGAEVSHQERGRHARQQSNTDQQISFRNR
jgi:hypothetical protein